VHDGANAPQFLPLYWDYLDDEGIQWGIKKRFPPTWIGEVDATAYMYFSWPSYQDEDLKDFTFIENTNDIHERETCRNPYHYKPEGYTPQAMFLDKDNEPELLIPLELRAAVDDKEHADGTDSGEYGLFGKLEKEKCLPGNLGRVGPFTSQVNTTLYPLAAARVAVHRGLRFVTEKTEKKYHPYRYAGGPWTFFPFPRSRYQELKGLGAPSFNPDVSMGCLPFWFEEKFIPDRLGPEDGDANINRVRTHHSTFWVVQWNPMRGCHAPCWPENFPLFPITK